MTELQVVYDAFLSSILDDEWELWTEEELNQDLFMLLDKAVPQFKFPRHSLEFSEEGFIEDLTREEINILASYMKCEWLNRTILTWENVKPLYEERDFSQANLIDKFRLLLEEEQKLARRRESLYYRSIHNKPFNYRDMGTHIQ